MNGRKRMIVLEKARLGRRRRHLWWCRPRLAAGEAGTPPAPSWQRHEVMHLHHIIPYLRPEAPDHYSLSLSLFAMSSVYPSPFTLPLLPLYLPLLLTHSTLPPPFVLPVSVFSPLLAPRSLPFPHYCISHAAPHLALVCVRRKFCIPSKVTRDST